MEVLDKIEYLNLSQANDDVQESPVVEQHILLPDNEIATIPVDNLEEKQDNNKENFVAKHANISLNIDNQENFIKSPEKDFDKEQINQTLNVIDINMQCETTLDNNFKIPNNIYLSSENKENNNKIENKEELSCPIEPEDNQTNLMKPREILVANKEPIRSSMSRRTQHKSYIKKTSNISFFLN